MTLAPLLSSPLSIQLHAFAAMAAFVLGLVQLAAPKGTLPHRTLGWIWVALMIIVGVSAFFIHTLRVWGPWSPFHLLALYTLVMLPVGIWQARRHSIKNHRKTMIAIFLGGLVIAGAFTFLPDRRMYAVVTAQ
jgi:uncharacterized membrane protein